MEEQPTAQSRELRSREYRPLMRRGCSFCKSKAFWICFLIFLGFVGFVTGIILWASADAKAADAKAAAEVVEANPIVTVDILDVVAGLLNGTASIIIRAIR
jgi:cytochrome b subunit of formate dehydrogenase